MPSSRAVLVVLAIVLLAVVACLVDHHRLQRRYERQVNARDEALQTRLTDVHLSDDLSTATEVLSNASGFRVAVDAEALPQDYYDFTTTLHLCDVTLQEALGALTRSSRGRPAFITVWDWAKQSPVFLAAPSRQRRFAVYDIAGLLHPSVMMQGPGSPTLLDDPRPLEPSDFNEEQLYDFLSLLSALLERHCVTQATTISVYRNGRLVVFGSGEMHDEVRLILKELRHPRPIP